MRLYYEPYHLAIDGLIEKCTAAGVPPVLLSMHSFTELWKGEPRPWHAAILWDRDHRFAVPLLEALRAETRRARRRERALRRQARGRLHVAARHAARARACDHRGAPGSDRDEAGQARWAERIAQATRAVLSRSDLAEALHRVQYFGSHTDSEAAAALPRRGGEERLMSAIDTETATELEAAAFRRLVQHLRERTDVQNIDLMNLAGFCRNCLSNWYQEAAAEKGVALTKDEARQIVYGMPYEEWQARHQSGESKPRGKARRALTRASVARIARGESRSAIRPQNARILWIAPGARLEAARRRR